MSFHRCSSHLLVVFLIAAVTTVNGVGNWMSNSVDDFTSCSDVLQMEAQVLMDWRAAMNGTYWKLSSGWTLENWNELCSNWIGIRCGLREVSNGLTCSVVTSMTLIDNNLQGPLNFTQLEALAFVQEMNFTQNGITALVASNGTEVNSLSVLDLSRNRLLRGELYPPAMAAMGNIRVLNLSQCDIQGIFAPEIGKFQSLETLNVELNNITGALPVEMSELTSMREFLCSGNFITGSIPDWIGNWTNLSTLLLSQNSFSGPIPSNLGLCRKIQLLDLSTNALSGSIPQELSQLTELKLFAVGLNKLSGPFTSATFGTWTQLAQMIIFENNLQAPGELTNVLQLPSMSVAVLSGNNFFGTVSTEICRLQNLQTINAYSCSLYGTIPECIGDMVSLRQLVFSKNNMHGTLPTELGRLTNMEAMGISFNNFTGTIPTEMSNIKTLQGYDFSFNQLEGALPEVPAGEVIFLNGNRLTSEIFDALLWIERVQATEINLAQNNLYGSLPAALPETTFDSLASAFAFGSRLNHVIDLDLSSNAIYGSMPVDLFVLYLNGLQRLNLSNTQITGQLPFEWFQLSNIYDLDVSGTNLQAYDPSLSAIEFIPHSAVPISENGELKYTCELVSFGRPKITVTGIGPDYYGFDHCSCLPGDVGRPPHCKPAPNRAVEIAVPLIVALFAGIVGGVVYYRRYKKRSLQRKADRLLADYPQGAEMGSASQFQSTNPGELSSSLYETSTSGGTSGSKGSTCIVLPGGTKREVTPDLLRFIIPYKDISILRPIAHGASGCVHLGLWRQTQVAVKVFYPSVDMDQCDFCTESAVHAQLRHPNIVLLLGVCMEPLATVQEFMPRGALYALLRSRSNRETLRKHSFQIAVDMCRGLAYLHSCNILHRDVKSLNVLIDNGWTAKVTDFGSSRHMSNSTMTAGIGTVAWMAPETFESGKYTAACDVYSVGMVLWELVSGGAMPFETVGFTFEVAQLVQSGERPTIPPMCRSEYRSIIEQCWNGDASQRPSMAEVVDMLEAIPGHPALVPPEMSLTGER